MTLVIITEAGLQCSLVLVWREPGAQESQAWSWKEKKRQATRTQMCVLVDSRGPTFCTKMSRLTFRIDTRHKIYHAILYRRALGLASDDTCFYLFVCLLSPYDVPGVV